MDQDAYMKSFVDNIKQQRNAATDALADLAAQCNAVQAENNALKAENATLKAQVAEANIRAQVAAENTAG